MQDFDHYSRVFFFFYVEGVPYKSFLPKEVYKICIVLSWSWIDSQSIPVGDILCKLFFSVNVSKSSVIWFTSSTSYKNIGVVCLLFSLLKSFLQLNL